MGNDFDTSVFIITNDNQDILVDEYDPALDGEGVFVMLTNDELDTDYGHDNSIRIHKDWKYLTKNASRRIDPEVRRYDNANYVNTLWQTTTYELIPGNDTYRCEDSNFSHYCDGFLGCQSIMDGMFRLHAPEPLRKYIPAVMLASFVQMKFDGYVVQGYLPALGQCLYIHNSLKEINDAMSLMNGDSLGRQMSMWSSTEFDETETYSIVYNRIGNMCVTVSTKFVSFHVVMPLFEF